MVAAKKLQDLAQGYGSKENIGVLVVRFNTDQGPSLARLRQHRSMSIDDIEAAAQHEARRQQKITAETTSNKKKHRGSTGQLDEVDAGERATSTPSPPPPPPPIVSDSPSPSPPPLPPPPPPVVTTEAEVSVTGAVDNMELEDVGLGTGLSDEMLDISIDGNRPMKRSSPKLHRNNNKSPAPPPPPLPNLKPLPKQKFRKKNIASEWEGILQRRLTDDVKDKELKQLSRSVSEESIFRGEEMQTVDIDLNDFPEGGNRGKSIVGDGNIETRAMKRESGTLRKRLMTPPWYHQVENQVPASYEQTDDDITASQNKVTDKRPKVRKTIAMFENMGKDDGESTTQGTNGAGAGISGASVAMAAAAAARRTVVLVERDERSPLNDLDHNAQNGNLTKPKVEKAQTVNERGEKLQEANGSVEGNLYATVKKVTKQDHNQNAPAAANEEDEEVTIVEIARL